MHQLGASTRMDIERAGGNRECMLNIPRWNFEWQLTYGFSEPKIVARGDRVGIQCRFDNSAANQPTIAGVQRAPADVNWGEGTTDEMCVGFIFATINP